MNSHLLRKSNHLSKLLEWSTRDGWSTSSSFFVSGFSLHVKKVGKIYIEEGIEMVKKMREQND